MNPLDEIKYLIGAIDALKSERHDTDLLERIRTLELCLLAAARKLNK